MLAPACFQDTPTFETVIPHAGEDDREHALARDGCSALEQLVHGRTVQRRRLGGERAVEPARVAFDEQVYVATRDHDLAGYETHALRGFHDLQRAFLVQALGEAGGESHGQVNDDGDRAGKSLGSSFNSREMALGPPVEAPSTSRSQVRAVFDGAAGFDGATAMLGAGAAIALRERAAAAACTLNTSSFDRS